jgi:hypothetical protein
VLAVLSFVQSFGQTDTERFFKFSPGYALQQGRDEGMSPLTYSGSHFNGVIGLSKIKTKTKCLRSLDIEAMAGRMRADLPREVGRSVADAFRMQLDFTQQRQVKTLLEEKIRVFVGGSYNMLANGRFHKRYSNNNINYEFSAAIGPSASVLYDFEIGKKAFQLSGRIDLPILAFNIRPAFASSIPEGFIAQESSNVGAFFESGRVQTLNRFFRLRNELAVQHTLKNGNRVFLAYRWDYYQIKTHHPVQMAVHQILLGWLFQF